MLIEHVIYNLEKIITFGVFLGILITVHEWGHFITAKLMGVSVTEFALGFGRTIFSKMYKGTNYKLKLFPLGGYVKMAGDERSKCTGAPDEFYSQPVWKRALIVINGPVVNFILAYICFVLMFMIGYSNPSTRVNGLINGSPAQKAGIQVGDKIIQVDGKNVYFWDDLLESIRDSKNEVITLKILRGKQEFIKKIKPQITAERNPFGKYDKVKTIGIDLNSNIIGWLKEGAPAQKAGLLIGDKIIRVGQKDIFGWHDLQNSIREQKGRQIKITVLRNNKKILYHIVPEEIKEKGITRKIIGIGPEKVKLGNHKFSLLPAMEKGWDKFVEITSGTCRALYAMITRTISPREAIGGPIMIFGLVADAVDLGISYFLFMLGSISLSLAIFNLLPVIPLDGGHLFLFGIEKIRGKALSPKTDDIITRIGFGMIMLLAIYVFYIDFDRIGVIDKIKMFFH